MRLLTGVVRNYDWGDREAIAGILGHEPTGLPEAEYWLGAHPSAPSTLAGDTADSDAGVALDQAIADDPSTLLGADVAAEFGGLPFLLKILAAGQPLSIQAHPNAEQARAGFEREDDAGIARDAKNRNYRDPNHKPELICAITPFEGKCGFRALTPTRQLLALLAPAADDVLARLDAATDGEAGASEGEALAEVVSWLLALPAETARSLAEAVVARAADVLNGPQTVTAFEAELAWTVRIGETYPGDVGVVVALLLNHVVLEPGQAIFLPAGNLHAYLEGVGVELMANSDNVLRGGLTPKHVDVDELLAVVTWDPSPAPVQTPSGPVQSFAIPVPEFGLTRFDAGAGSIDTENITPVGPEIVLVTSGSVTLSTSEAEVAVGPGQAAFVAASDGPYRLTNNAASATEQPATVAWRASVEG